MKKPFSLFSSFPRKRESTRNPAPWIPAFAGMTILLAATLSTPSFAKDPVREHRRTSYLAFGQKRIMLEAPLGMCFLDETNEEHAGPLAQIKALMQQQLRGVVMGIFSDCYKLGSIGTSPLAGGPEDIGAVVWMNPEIGESTGMTAADYLDMREASLGDHARAFVTGASSALIDEKPKRTQNTATVTYITTDVVDYQKNVTTGIIAASVIENVPIDFILMHNGDKPDPDRTGKQALMEKFVDQQVVLNDVRQ